jgi:membrane protein involved in colicin uptake
MARKSHKTAEKPLRAIVEVREKIDGAESVALVAPLESLAVVLKATDRTKEAEEVAARVKTIREAEKKAAEEAKKATEEAKKAADEARKTADAAAKIAPAPQQPGGQAKAALGK